MTKTGAVSAKEAPRPGRQDDGATHRPGSSREKDALVGGLSEEKARRIPGKRLRLYRFLQIVLSPLIRLVLRVRPLGMEKIPRRGPVLLASNHSSWFDPLVVVGSVRRPISALAKSYLFRGWFRTTFFETLGGQIRVDRERGGNLAAVGAAVAALEKGRLIAVWPEGGRSPNGHLTRGKTGIGRIALASGAPVYPVAVLGTYRLMPKGGDKIRWGTPLQIICGEPLSFPDLVGRHEDRAVTREVTDRIMLEVAKLMGPEEEARYRELLEQDVPPGELPLDKRERPGGTQNDAPGST